MRSGHSKRCVPRSTAALIKSPSFELDQFYPIPRCCFGGQSYTMLSHRPRESLSQYIAGITLAVSLASSAAFTFDLTGRRQHPTASRSMHPSVRNPPACSVEIRKRAMMSLDHSFGFYQLISGKADLFQDFLMYYDVQVLIWFFGFLS
jgi:hypothetical protein